jgi:hypothetical protein
MEPNREEATTEKPARRGAWAPRWSRKKRGQEARKQGERPQGRPGQKPQEDTGRAPQRSAAEAWTLQEKVSAAITAIRMRFGTRSIGLGDRGIRYVRRRPGPVLAGNPVPATSRGQGECFFLGNGR